MADDFLADVLANTAPVEPETPASEPEAVVEPAPETVEAPPVVEPEPAPHPEQPKPGYVPLDAMLTEREKRQAAERRIAEFEAQRTPKEVPDPFDDPEGYRAHLGQELQSALQAQKVDMSWQFAVQQHGEEKVEAAKQWALDKAQKDPGFRAMLNTEFTAQPLPIGWVVQQHQRDEAVGKLAGKTLDDWFNEELARRNLSQSAPAAVVASAPITPALKQAMPPRSIAGDASPATSVANANPMASLDAIFDRR